ncbi:MAG: hypothetical protein KAG84_00225 [Bacteroidales bacterium]|nr:hypothetical protein [Bacteroidales bacterium]
MKRITKTVLLLAIIAISGILTLSYSQLSNNSSKTTISQIGDEANIIAFADISDNFYTESKCGEGKCGEGKSTESKPKAKKSKKEKKSEKSKETKKSTTKEETKSAKESKCGAGKCGGK